MSNIFLQFKKLPAIALIISLAACESCNLFGTDPKSELEKLPPATQQGKNTFGCLVNGKAWVTRTSTDVTSFYQSGALQVSAGIDESGRDQGISLILLNSVVQGASYDLTNDPQYQSSFSWIKSPMICFYEAENTLIGNLTITKLDQTNLIIAGRFEFTTVVSNCDTIRVTDGRFDLLYAN